MYYLTFDKNFQFFVLQLDVSFIFVYKKHVELSENDENLYIFDLRQFFLYIHWIKSKRQIICSKNNFNLIQN